MSSHHKTEHHLADGADGSGNGSGAELSAADIEALTSRRGLELLLSKKHVDVAKVLRRIEYEHELKALQVELVRLQRTIQESGRRVAILFEGRDAAGKGGTIRRFTEHLSPRGYRVVALPKPSEVEREQWYFQRYIRQLPNPGEIVLFDRSWYNRATVEPVMGFCTAEQHETFLRQVPEFEHMLFEDGIEIVKFWFSISKQEQRARFEERKRNPLKQWKLSPVDATAQDRWDAYTHYKEQMFSRTHSSFSPWIIVKADSKRKARLESIRYVLSTIPYGQDELPEVRIQPDPDIVSRFYRETLQLD